MCSAINDKIKYKHFMACFKLEKCEENFKESITRKCEVDFMVVGLVYKCQPCIVAGLV